MKSSTRISLGVLLSALAFASVAIADPANTSSTTATQDSKATSTAMHHDMMTGMQEMHGMKPTGDADRDFAHMMEHHHAPAVQMTQTYLKGAKNAQLRTWADKSLKNQQKELDELKKIQASMGSAASSGT